MTNHFTWLFFFCFSCSTFIAIARARAFVAQITYSGSPLSPLYFASNLSIGTPPQSEKLLISTDAASHSWVECGHGAPFDPSKSSSFMYARCSKKPCYEDLQPYNLKGRLAKDTFSLHTTNGSSQGTFAAVPGVAFACADATLGLGLGFQGVASFTASKPGLPAQLGVSKFAYCLPSSTSNGPTPLFLGEGISYLFGSSPVLMNISGFLAIAKLNVNPKTGYFSVGLNNVSVDEVPLSLSSPLRLRISSVEPFTKLSRRVYLGIRKLFRDKAAERGIKQVRAQSPFDTCFNASTIGFSRVGPAVPGIELKLAGDVVGDDVGWTVYGFNSIVSVSESVSCWAFLDAGVHKPSVLGSYQQQGNLFEFDLRNKKLGFSGVLDFYRTRCSNFNF